MMTAWAVLGGFVLDAIFGDPAWLPHPVVYMGKAISRLEKFLRARLPKTPQGELLGGAVVAFCLPVGTLLFTGLVCWGAAMLHPLLGLAVQMFWCGQALAAKGLMQESMNVYAELKKGSLPAARKAVSRIVGRDTEALTAEGVTKAAVETVAENASDGVIAPLLYMLLGGAPLALTYKAINTMDSMLGYKNEKYLYFGRAAAKLDDVANYIPSRLAALLWIMAAAFTRNDAKGAWRIWRRDRHNHASPNSAQTESACAGALGLGAVGAGVIVAVPPPDTPCALGVIAGERRRHDPEQRRQTARDIVRHIVQFCSGTAKVEIFFVFVAQHTVHRVDGLVGQGQRRTAQQHIKQRRNDAVAGVLGHRLHRRFGHALGGQSFRVAAHDAAHSLPGGGQAAFFQLGIDIHALLHQPLCGQCLPTPEHLDGQPQQGVKHRRAPADKAREQQRPHRQTERHHCTAQQLALRRFGQAGAKEFFQPRDGFSHVHHRVGQPRRVAEDGIQHEASQHSPGGHHTSASASFVYCTVFTRRSWRFSAQSAASST